MEASSLQLVEDVLGDRLNWKRAVVALGDRAPDAASARAVALAFERGAAAFADLAAILADPAFDRPTHEGAAYGLAEIRDPRALDALMAAVDAKRVRMSTAGSVVSERPLVAGLLLAWLRGDRAAQRTVAMWALFYRSASDADTATPPELAAALLAELDRGGSPFTEAQEAMLRERLTRPIVPLPIARLLRR